MILPRKQLALYESLFGFGAFLLQSIRTPISIDDLWKIYKSSSVSYTHLDVYKRQPHGKHGRSVSDRLHRTDQGD